VGDTLPRRPFFGLNKKEIREIVSQFKDDVQSNVEEARSSAKADKDSRSDFTKRALEFLDRLESQDDGVE
jgi:hypothetical protein